MIELCDCSADIEKRARKGGGTCTSVHDYEEKEGCELRKAYELGRARGRADGMMQTVGGLLECLVSGD